MRERHCSFGADAARVISLRQKRTRKHEPRSPGGRAGEKPRQKKYSETVGEIRFKLHSRISESAARTAETRTQAAPPKRTNRKIPHLKRSVEKMQHPLHERTGNGQSHHYSDERKQQRTENTGAEKIKQAHGGRRGALTGGEGATARNADPGRCRGTPEPAAIPARSDLARGCADRRARGRRCGCRWRRLPRTLPV